MGGYKSMGRKTTATPPMRMMTSDRTQAKIGRSMKNLANTRVPSGKDLYSWSFFGCSLACLFWVVAGPSGMGTRWGLTISSGCTCLKPVDDYPIAGRNARGDDLQVIVDGAQSDGAPAYFVLFTHDEHILESLVGANGFFRNQKRMVFGTDGHAMRTN